MGGFVFFDTETTGLRRGWDQIIHFAAIRTDDELNETGRFEVRCRLQPHVVPHPMALLTNGIPIAQLRDPTLPSHYDMVCRIRRQLMAWSPAIFVGYNSIGFDEHMLRHALFQSLHDAYLTSSPGCGRADALGLALTASALPPNCVIAPRNEAGRPVFKLDAIARANGFVHTRTHDALSDTYATLQLCRLVRERSTEVWARFVRFSTKAAVSQFIETEDGFVLTEFFGNEPFHRSVSVLGGVPGNPNARFCLDLSMDPEVWAARTDEEIQADVARKGSPIRRLAINAAPTLTALWDAPASLLDGVEVGVAEGRARRLKDDPALCNRLIAIYTASWRDDEPSPHPEEMLYAGGFPKSESDKAGMRAFHDARPEQRLAIVREFADPRLQVFGRRLIHDEHRSWLTDDDRLEGDLDLASRLVDDTNGPFTLGQALAEVDELIAREEPDPLGLLGEYRAWLVERSARVAEFRQKHATH